MALNVQCKLLTVDQRCPTLHTEPPGQGHSLIMCGEFIIWDKPVQLLPHSPVYVLQEALLSPNMQELRHDELQRRKKIRKEERSEKYQRGEILCEPNKQILYKQNTERNYSNAEKTQTIKMNNMHLACFILLEFIYII